MKDKKEQVHYQPDERMIYSGLLVLMLMASLYMEYAYDKVLLDFTLDCFTGVGIGTMIGKIVFNK